jgi:hypothetical protein
VSRPELLLARNGEPTAVLGSRHLHSRFAPSEEADRFVRQHINARYQAVIVIGPGLGYCFAALRQHLPDAHLIGCSLSSDLAQSMRTHPDGLWHPRHEGTLHDFLTRELTDLDTASLLVVEWPPVAEAFPAVASEVRRTVSVHLRRGHGSLVTQGAAGRRWLRNRVHNYRHVRPAMPHRHGRGIAAAVLVGAGPSGEEALRHLASARDRIELWVTGSALDTTIRHGLTPDVVVVTDAAVYATEHLREVIAGRYGSVPVAAPLSATRGISRCGRVYVLSEGDPFEHALFARAGYPAPIVPPHGTVSATAAALIRQSGGVPIVCVGLDFAWRSDRSHARPHLSETYRRAAAGRLAPEATTVYAQTADHRHIGEPGGEWRTNSTLSTYAEWFRTDASSRYAPITALDPSPAIDGIPVIDPSVLHRLNPAYGRIGWTDVHWPPLPVRRRILTEQLHLALETTRGAREPARPRDLGRSEPALASLAARLALPELLRWYQDAEPRRSARWDDVRSAIERELSGALDGVR